MCESASLPPPNVFVILPAVTKIFVSVVVPFWGFDRKLSDILNSKKESNDNYIDSTADFSKELDRILHKLNEKDNDYNEDSTLDETTDFTNMF